MPTFIASLWGYNGFISVCLGFSILRIISDYVYTWRGVFDWLNLFMSNRYSSFVDLDNLVYKKSEMPCTSGKIIPTISFMGGGHLWMFALGCGHYLFENYDVSQCKFLASSCGCFAAVPLICGLDPYVWCTQDWASCIAHYNTRYWLLTYLNLGCLMDEKQFYYDLWDNYLPPDAHIKCSGRLYLSTTLWPSLKSHIISNYESREQLIWSIVGSICVPIGFIGDFPIDIPGVGPVIDGGFSNDCPCLDSYTITCSALHNACDISPRYIDEKFHSDNYLQNPISMMDIFATPSFDRVWEVARVGELAVEHCSLMNRKEWADIKIKNPVHHPAPGYEYTHPGSTAAAAPAQSHSHAHASSPRKADSHMPHQLPARMTRSRSKELINEY